MPGLAGLRDGSLMQGKSLLKLKSTTVLEKLGQVTNVAQHSPLSELKVKIEKAEAEHLENYTGAVS